MDHMKNEISPDEMRQAAGGEGSADLHALYVRLATKVILAAKEKYGKFFTLERDDLSGFCTQ